MKDNKKLFHEVFRSVVALEELPTVNEAKKPDVLPSTPGGHSRRRFKVYATGTFAALVFICVSWMLCSVYLSKIVVAGESISAHSSDKVLALAFQKKAATYRLGVSYPDGVKKQYPLARLGLTLDKSASVRETRQQQHKLLQRIKWWQPVLATITTKTDAAVLNKFIATEANVVVQPSQDAVLSIEKGEIKITDSVAGKQYGLEQPQKTILSSARSLKPVTIKLKTLTVNPPLTAGLLEPFKVQLEATINQPIRFTVGYKTIKPSPSDVANWLEITPDDKSKKVDVTVNSGKVLEYINDAAGYYVYPAKAQIETRQADGTTRVLVPGVDGVDVTNKSDTAAAVAKTLLGGKGIDIPLAVNYQSFKTITTGSYDKWIEVDLTSKRMYAYEKDTLVKTELVTAGAPGTPTVTGQYAIYAKYDQQDMRGNNVDGSRYYQPHVRWISYFYRDYAIHGNYWRPLSYFGNINSSHGCVSLIDSEAEWMYSWAPIGTPVVVHT